MGKTDYDALADHYDDRYDVQRLDDLARELHRRLGDGRRLCVLEVGCGTGRWLAEVVSLGHDALGLDASPRMLARAVTRVPGVPLVCGDAGALPLADACCDVVLSINSFHHFDDPRAFLSEAHRVLRSAGRLGVVLLDPHDGVRTWWLYDHFEGTRSTDERRYPPPRTIRAWMEAAGFTGAQTTLAKRLVEEYRGREALRSPFMQKGGTSQLALLSRAAYDRGLRRVERTLAEAESRGDTAVLRADLDLLGTWARKRD